MRRVNPERRARRESEGLVYGEIHEFTKRLPCTLEGHGDHTCDFYPPERRGVESHHVKSVGAGGQDRNGTVPLCPAAHDEVHRLGLTTWCDRYRMDLRSIACEVTARFDAETGDLEGDE
jgi:hypothetical protein